MTALAELEGLKAELKKARQEVDQQKVAAAKVEKDRDAEKVAREKDQARVLEVEETLKGVFEARDKLQAEETKVREELKKIQLAHSEIQTTAQADREMLSKWRKSPRVSRIYCSVCFGGKGCVDLTQLWHFTEVFAYLLKSVEDAVVHFGQLEGHEQEKAFWRQFQGSLLLVSCIGISPERTG